MIQPGQEQGPAGQRHVGGVLQLPVPPQRQRDAGGLRGWVGITFGLGTAWLMFENGVLLGALGAVFVEAGETLSFCTGILPHGVLEIPACLLGGAGGFVLGAGPSNGTAVARGYRS